MRLNRQKRNISRTIWQKTYIGFCVSMKASLIRKVVIEKLMANTIALVPEGFVLNLPENIINARYITNDPDYFWQLPK